MRISRLMLASTFAATLFACDGDGTEENNDGGSGGSTPALCRGARVVEMASTEMVLNDRTDTVGNFEGSCTPEDTVGNDVVVRYTFPEDGHYHFTTGGSDFDTVLYALSDCDDGFTELRCNNDFFTPEAELTLLDRKAGEVVFVVVDSMNVKQSRPFTLTVSKVETPRAPVIETFDAYSNPTTKSVGVVVSGQSPDAPLVAYGLKVYAPGGAPLVEDPIILAFADPQYQLLRVTYGDNGTFEVVGEFAFGSQEAEEIGAVELAFLDVNEQVSTWEKRDTKVPPTLAPGSACSPGGGLGVCQDGYACTQAGVDYTCTQVN